MFFFQIEFRVALLKYNVITCFALTVIILMFKLGIYMYSAPVTSSGGFSFGTVLGTPATATTSTTTTLGLGGSMFAQKPTGGFSFNTPASSNICFLQKYLHLHEFIKFIFLFYCSVLIQVLLHPQQALP